MFVTMCLYGLRHRRFGCGGLSGVLLLGGRWAFEFKGVHVFVDLSSFTLARTGYRGKPARWFVGFDGDQELKQRRFTLIANCFGCFGCFEGPRVKCTRRAKAKFEYTSDLGKLVPAVLA
jgi:hypothetical protein